MEDLKVTVCVVFSCVQHAVWPSCAWITARQRLCILRISLRKKICVNLAIPKELLLYTLMCPKASFRDYGIGSNILLPLLRDHVLVVRSQQRHDRRTLCRLPCCWAWSFWGWFCDGLGWYQFNRKHWLARYYRKSFEDRIPRWDTALYCQAVCMKPKSVHCGRERTDRGL
jgi:hypothetical protein